MVPDSTMQMKPQLNQSFDWEPMPDGCLLFSQETGQVLTVNPTAELILSFCDGENSLDQIYGDITKDLELPRESFLETIDRFISEKVLLADSTTAAP